jgi:hypothetical protein
LARVGFEYIENAPPCFKVALVFALLFNWPFEECLAKSQLTFDIIVTDTVASDDPEAGVVRSICQLASETLTLLSRVVESGEVDINQRRIVKLVVRCWGWDVRGKVVSHINNRVQRFDYDRNGDEL